MVYSTMERDEADELIAELKAWAAQAKYGEQKEVAKSLGVSQGTFNHWITGRRLPDIRKGLKLQTFLKKQRHKKPKPEDKSKA
jgi:predicted XRE-type DNA-binding protein